LLVFSVGSKRVDTEKQGGQFDEKKENIMVAYGMAGSSGLR
jgi:hypothetical protein